MYYKRNLVFYIIVEEILLEAVIKVAIESAYYGAVGLGLLESTCRCMLLGKQR